MLKVWIGGLLVGAILVGWGILSAREWMVREFKDGWEQVCLDAPHARLGSRQLQGLREANILVGLHDWQPTVEWVNEQCRALGYFTVVNP